MSKPQIAAVEGSEATIEAFRRLTASITGLLTLSPPLSPDELRQLQKKAIQKVTSNSGSPAPQAYMEPTGLGKRDYVPLAIAIFVDLCLLLVSIGRPMNRLNNLLPKMRDAEKGPVIQILSRFNEIHRDPEIRQNFEVFRHVVFDYLGDYYVAVPLDTPYNRGRPGTGVLYGSDQAQELQHEAHLLANLFTSFEQEKIFKRVYFMPTRTVRKRLQRQGSKFAGSCAFRLYRFKEGAWSDIILGAVMGAAKRVEAEKEHRRVLEQTQNKSRGPTLEPRTKWNDLRSRAGTRGHINGKSQNGTKVHEDLGEAGPSSKTPSDVLNHRPGAHHESWAKNGQAYKGRAKNGARDATGLNGDDKNGFTPSHTSGRNPVSPKHASTASSPIIIEEDYIDEDLDPITAEDEQQIRSRYGKYADKILAERTQATHRRASHKPVSRSSANVLDQTLDSGRRSSSVYESKTPTKTFLVGQADAEGTKRNSRNTSDKSPKSNDNSGLTAHAANSNTVPSATKQSVFKNGHGDKNGHGVLETAVETPEVIWLPAVKPSSSGASSRATKTDDASAGIIPRNVKHESQPFPANSPLSQETTVTLTRETATYTVPTCETAVPPPLQQIVSSATPSDPVVPSPKKQDRESDEHLSTTSLPQPPPLPDFSNKGEARNQGVETNHDDETVVTVAVRLKPELNS